MTNPKENEPAYLTEWIERIESPIARVRKGAGHPQAHHPLGGTRLKASVYLDGSVRFYSAEFGSLFFGRAPFHEGARRTQLEGTDLDLNDFRTQYEFGIGSFRATVEMPTGVLTQQVVIPDLHSREALISFEWSGPDAPELRFPVEFPSNPGKYGCVYYQPSGDLIDGADGWIHARLGEPLVIRAGYNPSGPIAHRPADTGDVQAAFDALSAFWKDRFARLKTDLTGDRLRELKWAIGLMIGTCIYDGTRGQLACTNGALYAFHHLQPELDQREPWYCFSFRDGNQVAFSIAEIFPEIAREQILRNFTAFRHDFGIPQVSTAIPGGEHRYQTPGSDIGGVQSVGYSSDQVYWAIKALTQYIRVTGEYSLLDLKISNTEGEERSIREHLTDMLRFADEAVGYGPHGLCRFLSGDWSDYLDEVGLHGRGESFMNCALSIIAKTRLAWILEQAGETEEPAKLRTEAEEMRQRVETHLTGAWYPRGYDDEGGLVGGPDGHIYAEAQSWLPLARCGSPEFRKKALLTTMERCLDRAGMLIIDRPLEESERARRTRIPYQCGHGENGGLWWLTGYWLAIAMDEAGLRDEALQVYDACSMDNHHRLFPAEWWSPWMCPDGIDGPASQNYGKPQQLPGFNRESFPNEVAKFAYQLFFASKNGLPICW